MQSWLIPSGVSTVMALFQSRQAVQGKLGNGVAENSSAELKLLVRDRPC